jgi:hypothetical protein
MAGLDYVPAVVPVPGQVVSVVLQMATFGVLCICFSEYESGEWCELRN